MVPGTADYIIYVSYWIADDAQLKQLLDSITNPVKWNRI
jgi:hypothetical protein